MSSNTPHKEDQAYGSLIDASPSSSLIGPIQQPTNPAMEFSNTITHAMSNGAEDKLTEALARIKELEGKLKDQEDELGAERRCREWLYPASVKLALHVEKGPSLLRKPLSLTHLPFHG